MTFSALNEFNKKNKIRRGNERKMGKNLPLDGEKFNGFAPACVWRLLCIVIGLDASFADDERIRIIGAKLSSLLDLFFVAAL
jgi:hypothetical protein